MITNIKNTFYVLNEQYTNYNGSFNKAALEDILEVEINSTRKYIEAIRKNKRQKIAAIVWAALIDNVNGLLQYYEQSTTQATSEQIKKWFASVGTDYKTALAGIIAYYEDERKEYNEQ